MGETKRGPWARKEEGNKSFWEEEELFGGFFHELLQCISSFLRCTYSVSRWQTGRWSVIRRARCEGGVGKEAWQRVSRTREVSLQLSVLITVSVCHPLSKDPLFFLRWALIPVCPVCTGSEEYHHSTRGVLYQPVLRVLLSLVPFYSATLSSPPVCCLYI